MLRLHIKNFRGVAAAEIASDKPILVFSGLNGAGKTSIAAAIEFALTGGACGLRGRDSQWLARRGATGMRVAIDVDDGLLSASRTTSTGTPLQSVSDQVGTPSALLPLLFQPAAGLLDGGKLIRNYLRALAEAAPTALEAAGNAQELIPLAEAIRARTPAGILAEMEEKRASNQQQTPPVKPTQARPDLEKLRSLTDNAGKTAAEVGRLETLLGSTTRRLARLRAVPQIREQIAQAQAADAAARDYEKRRSRIDDLRLLARHLRAAQAHHDASSQRASDPLGACRAGLVELARADAAPIEQFAALLERAGLAAEAQAARGFHTTFKDAIATSRSTLELTPAPPGLPPLPEPLPAEIRNRWQETLAGGLPLVETTLRQAEGELGPKPIHVRAPAVSPEGEEILRLSPDGLAQALQEAEQAESQTSEQLQSVRGDAAQIAGQLVEAEVAARQWADFDTANRGISERNAQAKQMWERWHTLRARFEQVIVQKQAEGCDAFLRDLETLGAAYFKGRRLQLSPEGALALGNVPLATLSGSEQWRVGALITATIAKRAKCPLLVLDGADILDNENRRTLSNFLRTEIAPHFRHVLLLATPKRDLVEEFSSPVPSFIDRFLVSEGEVLPEALAHARIGMPGSQPPLAPRATPPAEPPATLQPALL